MAEEIGFENGRNSNFQGLVTLTFKLFVDGRTDVRTDGRTDIFPPLILLGQLLEVDLKMWVQKKSYKITVATTFSDTRDLYNQL